MGRRWQCEDCPDVAACKTSVRALGPLVLRECEGARDGWQLPPDGLPEPKQRPAAILELARQRGGVSTTDLYMLGMNGSVAYYQLHKLAKSGQLRRERVGNALGGYYYVYRPVEGAL